MSSVHRIVCMKRKFRFNQHKTQQKRKEIQKGGLCNVTCKVISALLCYRMTEILRVLSLVDIRACSFEIFNKSYKVQ